MKLRYFPSPNTAYTHRGRDYFIAGFTFFCVAVSLVIDAHANLLIQNILGVIAWVFLVGLLVGENREIRVQVVIAVAFATAGEHFASIYMGGYTYRFENVPLYVPPGHGMVYLTAVALARSGFFLKYARKIALFVVVTCGIWSLWGISGIPEHGDQVGAILYCVFLIYLFKGRSPMVYLAAFFITTWLEIIGTAAGTWKWATLEPIFQLSQGNPPSGVSAWYCLVDAVAIGCAPIVLKGIRRMTDWAKSARSVLLNRR
ncbi:MAG TPA: hypothetical protein PKD88_12300 [Nitrosomonas sp.]|nr:hypothetical protein [Nitrosomonas sp.]HMW21769.1 hypothetical protein [Nitrosomonas sp.]HMW70124.1 hypothetical protein [Nitrosomonas sp.]HMY62625.1 hypothetical protein [Nitrosomonas sp.]HMY91425.1 hypothetical protein [Nitrosomonas sp.]